MAPLRNDWKSSLKRGAELCRKYGHQGDAATIEDVLDHLEGPHGVKDEHRVKTHILTACQTCNRDPQRMNSEVAECSHVDCPHRGKAWVDGTPQPTPEPRRKKQIAKLFDSAEDAD